MKTLFCGWPVMVHDTHTKRIRILPVSWKLAGDRMRLLTNLLEFQILQWWWKWNVIWNLYLGPCRSPSKVNQFFRLVGTINNTKFQWNQLITAAVILLTNRMTERMTDKPHWSHNVHQLAACTDVSIQTVWRLVNGGSIWKCQFLQHRKFYQRTRLLSPTVNLLILLMSVFLMTC